jgi:hypothetical protein
MTPSNQPLEWTGLLKASCSGIQSLPATQGQRWMEQQRLNSEELLAEGLACGQDVL